MWGEVHTWFSYIAIVCLSTLQRLGKINEEKAMNCIMSWKNLNGGFGYASGAECWKIGEWKEHV